MKITINQSSQISKTYTFKELKNFPGKIFRRLNDYQDSLWIVSQPQKFNQPNYTRIFCILLDENRITVPYDDHDYIGWQFVEVTNCEIKINV